MRIRIATILALFVTSVSGAQSVPRIRDSAGVRIIENGARLSAPVRFALGTKPLMDVGGLEDNTANEFNHKQGYLRGVLLSTGDLAVIDVNRLHFFDPAGKRKRIVGREGSGPGEFRYLTGICRTRGDSIVVTDARNSRLTVLDGTGSYVRDIVNPDPSAYLPFNGCLGDGTFVLQRFTRMPESRSIRVTRHRLDGSVVDSVGPFDAGPYDMATQREAQVIAAGKSVYFADGFGDVRVFAVSEPRQAALVPAREGTLRQTIIRSADPLVGITDEDREKGWMSTIPTNTPSDQVKQRMDRMRAMPRDKTWPAHFRAQVDPAGRVWLEDYPRPNGVRGWTAFDADGKLLGRLIIPSQAGKRFDVVGFEGDRLLVARYDDDGAAHLTLYPILPVR
jgi:hypothetical protein